MSNSSLVTYTKLSPNHSGKRTKAIDTVTIHCVVGHLKVATIAEIFAPTSRQASCNYAVDDYNGIALIVDEANRSWCTSSETNDQRAITIEVASDAAHPYAFTDSAYATLMKLVVDICKRNNIKKLVWSTDKTTRVQHLNGSNMTVHRDYANKACPGDWMYSRMGTFAEAVNKQLTGDTSGGGAAAPSYTVQVTVTDLNIRKSPSATAATNGYTGKGVFTIVDTQNGWGKLKSGAGWIKLDMSDRAGTAASNLPYMVRVDTADLRIRKGPGTNYGTNGYTGKGTFTIVEESTGTGATKWGKLKSGAGWISLDYAKKV